jgi:hypothetical protein
MTRVPGMGWSLDFKGTEGDILALWEDDPAAAWTSGTPCT